MDFSVSTLACSDPSRKNFYALIKKFGFMNIDIAPTQFFSEWKINTTRGEAFKKMFTKHQLSAVGMQSLFYGTNNLNLFEEAEPQWQSFLSHFNRIGQIANYFGIKNLVFGSPKNRDVHATQPNNIWKLARHRFSILGSLAEQHGCCLCIEPVPETVGGNFLTTTLETLRFVTELDSPNIALNLDTAAVHSSGESIEEIFAKGFDYIKHMHISEPGLGGFGSTVVNHDEFAYYLNKYNYEHTVALEMLAHKENEQHELGVALDYIVAHYKI